MGGKINKKMDREKEEEGREAKIGTRGFKISEKSRKRAIQRAMREFRRTDLETRGGGRENDKSSPRTEQRGQREENSP